MKEYIVTIAPSEPNGFTPPDRRPRWTLHTTVEAKSKNDARTQALRKTRPFLADRAIRISRVQEA